MLHSQIFDLPGYLLSFIVRTFYQFPDPYRRIQNRSLPRPTHSVEETRFAGHEPVRFYPIKFSYLLQG